MNKADFALSQKLLCELRLKDRNVEMPDGMHAFCKKGYTGKSCKEIRKTGL